MRFAKKCIENENTMDMFPKKTVTRNTRNTDIFEVPFARTSRMARSAIPTMANSLNQHSQSWVSNTNIFLTILSINLNFCKHVNYYSLYVNIASYVSNNKTLSLSLSLIWQIMSYVMSSHAICHVLWCHISCHVMLYVM